ncbi:MAG: LysR family transcriptional regulator [Woeseiaceae bacterium]|nr:LysR family transcriptional regulator [Woeseiaceae bacterium]
MNFQELRVFSEVARAGGITAAASNLEMAKSAVSKQLSRLEARLQVKLFARSSRRVSLTREGERLLPRIESILAEGGRLIEDAHEDTFRTAGTVRIAATPDFGGLVAREFLPVLLDQYPELAVTMRLDYGFEDLQDPAIDLAIRIGRVSDERLVAHRLGEFRRIVVASPEFAERNVLAQPKDLSSVNCLVFSGSSVSSEWTLEHRYERGDTEQIPVQGKTAVRGFAAIAGLAETGTGVCCVPEFVVGGAISEGRLVHCLPDWATRPTPVYLAYRFGADRIGRVRAVIDSAKAVIPTLLDSGG